MFGKRSELQIPDAAKKDSDAVEILRIWIAGGSQHVSLKTGVWEDPAAWGLMLADLAKHVANAYAADGMDKAEALRRVYQGLQVEMESPTDEPTGGITSGAVRLTMRCSEFGYRVTVAVHASRGPGR